MLCWTSGAGTDETKFTLYHFSLALQREQYLREKKMGSDAYRKALDAQVKTSNFLLHYFRANYET